MHPSKYWQGPECSRGIAGPCGKQHRLISLPRRKTRQGSIRSPAPLLLPAPPSSLPVSYVSVRAEVQLVARPSALTVLGFRFGFCGSGLSIWPVVERSKRMHTYSTSHSFVHLAHLNRSAGATSQVSKRGCRVHCLATLEPPAPSKLPKGFKRKFHRVHTRVYLSATIHRGMPSARAALAPVYVTPLQCD
jgi:hypothetical protein